MSKSDRTRHRGAREVTRADLDRLAAPAATATWFPLSHGQVLELVLGTLGRAGFEVARAQLALSRGDARFFGTLDLPTPVASGVSLAVGIRNSTDKSLPIAFCGGLRVSVCDNLAFTAEVVVARKHTRFGEARFNEVIARAVRGLHQYREAEAARVHRWQHTELSADTSDALLLRAYERHIVTGPLLPHVIREWCRPSFEEFQPRTLWSLFNAFTTVLAGRQQSNPQQLAALTIRLHGLLAGEGTAEAPSGLAC